MTDTAETRWERHNEAGRRAFREGDHVVAEQEFIAAIREANSLGENDTRLASSLAGLAQIKYLKRDFDQAEALFKRALAIRERALGDKHPDVAATLNSLARLYFHRNDHVAAAPLLMRLLAIKQESLGAHHPEVAVILTSLAKVRLAERQYEDAEQLARRALLIREEIHKPNDPAVAMSLDTLADVLAARGLLEEEQRLRKRIEEIRGGTSAQTPSRVSQSDPGGRTAPQAPPPAPPPEQRRTTRSASLPWIEPPTSPALRRPVPRPISTSTPPAQPTGSTAAPRPTSGAVRPTAPSPTPRNTPRFVARYAPPAGRPPEGAVARARSEGITGPVRGPLVQPQPAHREVDHVERLDSSREAHRAPYSPREVAPRRRSPVKLLVAALFVIGCAGGGWAYFSGAWANFSDARVTSSAGAALDASALEGGSNAARPRDGSALTPSTERSQGVEPPVRQRPPEAAYSDEPPVNVDNAPAQGTQSTDAPVTAASHIAPSASRSARATPPADTTSPLEPSAPVLPSANIDRITAAIGENARAKADSLGRKTITVKPPDFQKPDKP